MAAVEVNEVEVEANEVVEMKDAPLLVKETDVGEDEHPLEYHYTISYFVRPNGKFDPEEYAQYVRPVAIVKSVEQFWRIILHFKRPSGMTSELENLADKADIHFFKKGIKPVWEDTANLKGGKWIIRLKKGLSSRMWENLLLAVAGEQFQVGDEICGAVCSVRNQEDIISVWNKTAESLPITNRIRDILRKVLNLPQNTVLEYKKHDDCLKDQSSYRHTTNIYKC